MRGRTSRVDSHLATSASSSTARRSWKVSVLAARLRACAVAAGSCGAQFRATPRGCFDKILPSLARNTPGEGRLA